MKNTHVQPPLEQEVFKVATETIDSLEQAVAATETALERSTEPFRNEMLRRFPILFLLLVTFGFTAVLTGMEQMLLHIPFLLEHPIVMVLCGMFALIVTGTVYKKLG